MRLNLIAFAFLVLAGLGCGIDESVVKDEAANAAWGDVQAAYQRRSNLIPNLVATVKASASFEEKVFIEVAQARAQVGQTKISGAEAADPTKLKQFADAQTQLGAAVGRLIVAVEAYPQLKSTQAFSDLMVQLEGTENRIQNSIHKYNKAVQDYNVTVRRTTTWIGSQARGLKPRPPFHASEGAEETPKVDFGDGK